MQLNIMEDKKNRLVFEIEGMGHTYLNMLKTEMWNDDRKKRGFPTPQNHELLIHSLDDARVALKDLSFNLDGYNLQTTNPA